MTAAALLARARSLGIDVVALGPNGLRVLCEPARLPDDLRAELVQHKSEVLAALAAEREARVHREPCSDCGRTDWVVTVVGDNGARHCPACLRGEGGGRRASAR